MTGNDGTMVPVCTSDVSSECYVQTRLYLRGIVTQVMVFRLLHLLHGQQDYYLLPNNTDATSIYQAYDQGHHDYPHHQLHFASQVIVQKQQMYLGAKRTPPGKSGRALQLPRACAGCGCFTTCTGHGGNSSNSCSKTAPHKLISRYQTRPLQ